MKIHSLALVFILSCTSTPSSAPPPSPPPLEAPPNVTLEGERLLSFCDPIFESWDCFTLAGSRYLSSGSITISWYDQTNYDSTDTTFSWVLSTDGTQHFYACTNIAEVDGQLYCSNQEPSGEHSVALASGEGSSWSIPEGFFLGCDPDGDGSEALCTSTGADQPPFDGLQDIVWHEGVTDTVVDGIDIPGSEPLFWRGTTQFSFTGQPTILDTAPPEIYTFVNRARLDDTEFFILGHRGHTSLINALPPYTIRELAPKRAKNTTFLGHFLPDHEPVLLFLDPEESVLYSLEGELLATIEFERPYSEHDNESFIVFDIGGDGVDELLYENGTTLYTFRVPPLP